MSWSSTWFLYHLNNMDTIPAAFNFLTTIASLLYENYTYHEKKKDKSLNMLIMLILEK